MLEHDGRRVIRGVRDAYRRTFKCAPHTGRLQVMVFALKEQNRIIGQLRREANSNFMLLDDRSRRTQDLVQKLVAKVRSYFVEMEAIGTTCTVQYSTVVLLARIHETVSVSSLLRGGPFFHLMNSLMLCILSNQTVAHTVVVLLLPVYVYAGGGGCNSTFQWASTARVRTVSVSNVTGYIGGHMPSMALNEAPLTRMLDTQIPFHFFQINVQEAQLQKAQGTITTMQGEMEHMRGKVEEALKLIDVAKKLEEKIVSVQHR